MLAVSMSPPVLHYPMVQKRPKLSLQTSQLPISYGTSSRGLSTIATPTAAVTPTTLNTFSNTYDLTHRPSPTSTIASPTITRASTIRDRVSRSQSPRPKRIEAVYTVNLPYGIKPILKNSPFPRVRTNSISASPRSSTRRVFFPAPKQVHFRHVIEEEVVTHVYTACHSDFFLPDATDSDGKQADYCDPQETIEVSAEQSEDGSSISISSSKRRKTRRDSMDLLASTNSASSKQDAATLPPTTPARTRRRRKWEWTLAPVPSSPPSSASEAESESESGSASETADSQPDQDPTQSVPTTIAQPQPDKAQPKAVEQQLNPSTPSESSDQSKPQPPPSPSASLTTSYPLLKSHSVGPDSIFPKRASSLDSSSFPRKRKADCLTDSTAPGGYAHGFVIDDVPQDKCGSSAVADPTTTATDAEDPEEVTGRPGRRRLERRVTL